MSRSDPSVDPVASGRIAGARVASADSPVARLRGAQVDVDVRRAAAGFLALVEVGVLALSITLFVAGATKNGQIDALHARGVRASLTVTSCRGLIGGSGSNLVGYACHGSFTYRGRRYLLNVPGNGYRAPNSTVRIITDPSDPQLISTPGLLANQRSSLRVFVVPLVLFVFALAAAFVTVQRKRRERRAQRARADEVGGV